MALRKREGTGNWEGKKHYHTVWRTHVVEAIVLSLSQTTEWMMSGVDEYWPIFKKHDSLHPDGHIDIHFSDPTAQSAENKWMCNGKIMYVFVSIVHIWDYLKDEIFPLPGLYTARMVVCYQYFRTKYQSHLQGSETAWPWKMGPVGCPKTSAPIYQFTLHRIPEEWRSYLHCSG